MCSFFRATSKGMDLGDRDQWKKNFHEMGERAAKSAESCYEGFIN